MDTAEDKIVRATMSEVVVRKDRLLDILKSNKDAHRGQFLEALENYKTRSIELLEEHVERIRSGSVETVLVHLPRPEDHTDDYERAIATLEWTIFDEVELTIREFDMYVRDNWNWKAAFVATNTMYASPESVRAAASAPVGMTERE